MVHDVASAALAAGQEPEASGPGLPIGLGKLADGIYIDLGMSKPALVAALVYSFARAMTTVSAVIFLVTAENELATTYIIGRVGNGDYGVALAYCTVLIVLMSLVIALIQFFVGERKLGRRKTAALATPLPAL